MIVLEDFEPYIEYLKVRPMLTVNIYILNTFFVKPLQDTDPRLEVISRNGIAWDSYQFIEDAGLLDSVSKQGWDEGRQLFLQLMDFDLDSFCSSPPAPVHLTPSFDHHG